MDEGYFNKKRLRRENMEIIEIRDEFIKLGQVLKLAGWVESGADAKEVILDGEVKVNGECVLQRGKKIYNDNVVEYDGKKMKIKAKA